jgi:two-component system sensor histidine kinase/response regulator
MHITTSQLTQTTGKSREIYLAALVALQKRLLGFDNSKKCNQEIVEILGTFVQASRAYLLVKHQATDVKWYLSAEWCAADIYRQINNTEQNLIDEKLSRWVAVLSQGEMISEIVAELPLAEREILEPSGVLAILILPLIFQGEFLGFVGFENCVVGQVWLESEIAFLQQAAELISFVYGRNQAQEKQQKKIDQYRQIIETSQDIIWSIDIDGLITFINPAVKEIYGYEPAEMIGHSLVEFTSRSQAVKDEKILQRIFQGESIFQHETISFAKDGTLLYLLVNAVALRNQEGLIIGATGTVNNITKRQKAEQAKQANTVKLRNHNLVLTQLAKNQVLYQGNLQAAIREITEAATKNIGINRASVWLYGENFTTINCIDLFEENHHQHSSGFSLLAVDYPAYFQALQQDQLIAANDAHTDPRTQEFSESYLTPLNITSMLDTPLRLGGETVGVLCLEAVGTIHYWTLEDQNFARSLGNLVSLILEAKERQRAEAAYRKSQERLQLALAASDLGLWDWNISQGVIYFDWQWKKMLGYAEDEIEGTVQGFEELVHPEDYPTVSAAIDAHLQGINPVYEVEFRMRCASGEWKWIHSRGQIFEYDEAGKPLRMTGTHKDITEHKRAEQELRLANERLQYLLTSSPVVIYSSKTSGDFGHTFISENVRDMVGYEAEEFLADSSFWLQRIHPEDVETILAELFHLFEQEYSAYEYRFLHADGTYHWCYEKVRLIRDAAGKPIECVGYWADINDRKLAELALQNSQRRYQILAEASPVCIFHTDTNTNCLYLNQRCVDILGLSIKECLGKGWVKAVHPDDLERVILSWSQAIATKKMYQCEHRFVRPDGKVFWVICQALPEIAEDGQLKGYIGTVTDITDRKQAEVALRDSAERERAIAQAIQRMRQTLDLETIFAATTQELRQVLSCDRVVVYRFDASWGGEFVSESVGNGWISLVDECRNHPNLTDTTLKDGSCIEKMSETSYRLEDTYLQSNEGGIFNQGVSYRCIPNIYQANFDPCYLELLERFQAQAYITVPIFCGNQLWGLLASYQNSCPRHWKPGEINIVIQIGNQLGVALHQAQLFAQTQSQSQALQAAVIAADAANRAKSEFLANMSHELRTPLNAILGFTQVLSHDNSLSSENQQSLAIINRAGEHLLNLINDILEMSKIEAGRTNLNISSFDFIHLLANIEEMLYFRANAKQLKLIFEYDADIPKYIQSDESKIRQVLLNLLGNAIKFTDTGRVILRVSASSHKTLITDNQQLILHFEVQDTGVGIAPNEIDLLFEAFRQTESGRKSQQGTGLGLAISRKYVQLMGGDIRVESTLGKGSRFTFDIHASLSSINNISTQAKRHIIGLAPTEKKYRILVVDDAKESRLVLTKILTSIGFEVREVVNGEEAIIQWQQWQPHLILMDMMMPVMDGYEATKIIKSLDKSPNQIIIIAVTANAFEEQREVILQAGCDDLINKPFREDELLDKLREYLGIGYLYQEVANQVVDKSQPPKKSTFTTSELVTLISQMPSEWVIQIFNAAAQCSDYLIIELSEEIPSDKAILKEYLVDLSHHFDFEKIMELTSMVISG